MEENAVVDARGIFRIRLEDIKIIPLCAFAGSARLGQCEFTGRRRIIFAGGAKHLADDTAICVAVNCDNLVGEIDRDTVRHLCGSGEIELRQGSHHENEGKNEGQDSAQHCNIHPQFNSVKIIS